MDTLRLNCATNSKDYLIIEPGVMHLSTFVEVRSEESNGVVLAPPKLRELRDYIDERLRELGQEASPQDIPIYRTGTNAVGATLPDDHRKYIVKLLWKEVERQCVAANTFEVQIGRGLPNPFREVIKVIGQIAESLETPEEKGQRESDY